MLGNQREVRVGWVVEHRGCDEAASGGYQSRGRSLGSLRRDGFAFENALERSDFDERVGMDVDIVVLACDIGEEAVP